MEKGQRTYFLLGIGEEEREIQNAQPGVINVIKCVLLAIGVLLMLSKSGDKRTYVWAKAK